MEWRTDLRASLLRGAARAVVAAVVLAVVAAIAGGPLGTVATAVEVGLLAVPCALVESWAMRRSGARSILLLMPVVWVAAWIAIALAYLQAVYGTGVFEAGALEGGWRALELELKRLAAHDDDLASMWAGLPQAVAITGLAAGLVCSALVRPFGYHTTTDPDRVYGWPVTIGSCLCVYLATVTFAALVVMVGFAISEGSKVFGFSPLVVFFLGIAGLPTAFAFGLAHLVGDRVTRPFLEAPSPP